MTRTSECPLTVHRDQGEWVAVGGCDAGVHVLRCEKRCECDLHFCFRCFS